MISIKPLPALNDNYIWIIINEAQRCAAIVDPGDAKPVLSFLKANQLQLSAILITHHHWDHTQGIDAILSEWPVPVYAGANEPVPQRTIAVQDDDQFQIPGLDVTLNVIDTPGHTAGQVNYTGFGSVFTGDTLFTGGCGRIFEGTADELYHSLQKLARLPNDTLVYCGHEYSVANLNFAKAVEPNNASITQRIEQCVALRKNNQPTVPTTIATELATNPFLRCNQEDVIASASAYANTPLTNPVDVFTTLRAWKDQF